MMKRIVLLLSIFSLIFLLNACSNNVTRNTDNPLPDTNGKEYTFDSSDNIKVTINKNTSTSPDSEETVTDSAIRSEIPQNYKDYIKQLDPDNTSDICFFAVEDMDLDRISEIILATGSSGDDPFDNYVEDLYILTDENGVIKQLGDDLVSGGYMVYHVELIQMNGDSRKYLYCGLTNGVSLKGFKIIGLKDKKPYELCYSASATGAGEDKLTDTDNDGLFDGYIQYRSSYDVLYYSVIRTYKYEDNTFKLVQTDIALPDYPTGVKDVILQYLSLNLIVEQGTEEVNQRLEELCSDKNARHISFEEDGLYNALFNTVMEFPDGMDFVIDEQTDIAYVKISYQDESNGLHTYSFELKKLDGKWTITAIRQGQ